MSKISVIIQREYFSRVKKKSFIIMTILGPFLFAALMIVPIWFATQEQEKHFVEVIDESQLVSGFLKDAKNIRFDYPTTSLEQAQKRFYNVDSNYTAILWVPKDVLKVRSAFLYYKKNPGMLVQERIRSAIENCLYENQLEAKGIDMKAVDAAHIPINIITEKQPEKGKSERTNTGINMAIGFGCGILIYLFIFLYGVQVMKGVIEEKVNRVVEVIISSVKPFQLMMGKIVGVAMVGLTQFILWVILTMILAGIGQATFLSGTKQADIPVVQRGQPVQMMQNNPFGNENVQGNVEIGEAISALKHINFVQIIFAFLFYFLGGYLLYSAMFAAIGAAVDNETETQQFMLPVTLPLVIAFIAAQFIMQNPESPLSFWFSIIPFTSPVVMMVRLPFGVPMWEFILSMTLLVLTFIFMTWLAGKIYRTGILMYGKKVSYKELWKWLRYSG